MIPSTSDFYPVYKEIMDEITRLEKERLTIVNRYIHELEKKQIEQLRVSLGATQK